MRTAVLYLVTPIYGDSNRRPLDDYSLNALTSELRDLDGSSIDVSEGAPFGTRRWFLPYHYILNIQMQRLPVRDQWQSGETDTDETTPLLTREKIRCCLTLCHQCLTGSQRCLTLKCLTSLPPWGVSPVSPRCLAHREVSHCEVSHCEEFFAQILLVCFYLCHSKLARSASVKAKKKLWFCNTNLSRFAHLLQ